MKSRIKSAEELEKELKSKDKIFVFTNLYTIYWLNKNKKYLDLLSKKQNVFFCDSKPLSKILKKTQLRGPTFTKSFLSSARAKKKKHFFIGINNNDVSKLASIFNLKKSNLTNHNPPFIDGLFFSQKEIKKIAKKIKIFNPDYVWVFIASPKQEILSNDLFKEIKKTYINVGAAADFILSKKKEAPKIFQLVGLESMYRLITDFKYSKKKFWRSFIGLLNLKKINLKKGSNE